jgi:hypothetical protein
MAVFCIVTELSFRENWYLDVSLEMVMQLLRDGLYLVSPPEHIRPIHSRLFSAG